MSRTTLNFWLDFLLLLIFSLLLWCSIVVRFVFRPGQTEGWLLWGWHHNDWAQLQFVLVCVLAVGILLHVMMHWNWVCVVAASQFSKKSGAKSRPDEGQQTLIGVGFLIVLLHLIGGGVAAAWFSIQAPADF